MTDFVEAKVERLRSLTTALPFVEATTLGHLIDINDSDLLGALSRYDGKDITIDELKCFIAKKIVKFAIDYRYGLHRTLFMHVSTEQAKQIVKGSVLTNVDQLPSLTYGEIDFFSFSCILEKLEIKTGDIFVDLGHGTGRALICAALLFGSTLSRCVGIEIVPELCEISVGVRDRFLEVIASDEVLGLQPPKCCSVEVIEGDVLADEVGGFDWSVADIVFMNSTCFEADLMLKIAEKTKKMKIGAKVVTLTKQLPSDDFSLVDRRQYPMSWGEATCFMHVKITPPTH